MWFNPSEITKAEIPRVATLETFETLQAESEAKQEKVAEVAEVATAQKLETLKDRQREASKQKAISLMNESPDTPRGIFVDDQIDSDNIVVFVAVRSRMETCELTIPRERYDPFKLLELIERLGQATH